MKNLTQIKKAYSIIKPKSTVLPILECVLVMNDQLTITDLNTSVIFKNIGIGLNFVQDAKEFINVCGFVGNPVFKQDGPKLCVDTETESYSYRFEPIDNFPKIVFDGVNYIGKLNKEDCERIRRAVTVISKDELRPAMCAVCIKDGFIMATDAHSAIFERSDFTYSQQILIGKKSADLMALFPNGGYRISVSASRLVIENDDMIIIQRVDDNKFPDLLSIVPKEQPIEMKVDKNELKIAVKKALSCAGSAMHAVVFNVNSRLTLSSEDLMYDRAYKRQMSCNHTGADIEIGFNARMILKLIDSIKTPELSFKMTNASSCCVINENALQMPVMLNKY